MKTLAAQHDCLLIDLDGTVFRGDEPTDGAVESMQRVQARKFFTTNNASRSAAEVAANLSQLGFTAVGDDVVTSAQTAAHLLAEQLSPASPVLIVGTESLAAEIAAVGLRPVRRWRDEPVAVVQGHSADTGWADLAEAALAIRGDALWMATNVDRTLPSERGLLPGNGAMVAALRVATDAEPRIAGKPSPALMRDALAGSEFQAPLVIGDRLDTDIAGANAAGLPSLMVLTGVSSARDAVEAVPERRPTYIARDLRSLHEAAETVAVAPQPDWQVHVTDAAVTVESRHRGGGGDGLSIVRALAQTVWDAGFDGKAFTVESGDDTAREALQRWSLLGPLRSQGSLSWTSDDCQTDQGER
jgi:HAD superfamily hydrolase (TIGR01450 family)